MLESAEKKKKRKKNFSTNFLGDRSGRIFVEPSAPLGYDNLFFPAAVLAAGVAAALAFSILESLRKSMRFQSHPKVTQEEIFMSTQF